jgi:hypothetical protein
VSRGQQFAMIKCRTKPSKKTKNRYLDSILGDIYGPVAKVFFLGIDLASNCQTFSTAGIGTSEKVYLALAFKVKLETPFSSNHQLTFSEKK